MLAVDPAGHSLDLLLGVRFILQGDENCQSDRMDMARRTTHRRRCDHGDSHVHSDTALLLVYRYDYGSNALGRIAEKRK